MDSPFSVLEQLKFKPKSALELSETISLELAKYIQTINRLTDNLKKLQSDTDKYVTDMYHMIELEDFNACRGYTLARELQLALRHRREIKKELERLSILKETLMISEQMKKREEIIGGRSYTFRVSDGSLKYIRLHKKGA